MEDTAILRSLLQWLFPGGRLTPKVIFFWFLLIALFAGYGFIDSRHQLPHSSFNVRTAAQNAMLTGGLGVGIVSCIMVGLLILANVQANRLGKGSAILHLLTASFVSTIATPVSIVLARPLFPESWDLLRGEGVMGIVGVSWWMAMAAITLFALLTTSVLLSQQQTTNGVRHGHHDQ